METNELKMRTGTGRTKYGHKREGNTGHGEHRSDITPSNVGVGALEASRDTETGQEASRAAPVPGPTAEREARAAMADPGTREAMTEQGARAALAEQGIQEAMAGLPPRPRPQPPPRPLQLEPYYIPQKISLGKVGARSGTWGRTGGAGPWGRSGSMGSWGRSGSACTWGRSGSADTWGALAARAQHSAFEGLALEGAVEERAQEGAVEEQPQEGAVEEQALGLGKQRPWACIFSAGRLVILSAGGLSILSAGGLGLAVGGGMKLPRWRQATWAANGGGLGRATGGRLALASDGGCLRWPRAGGRLGRASGGRLALAHGRLSCVGRRGQTCHGRRQRAWESRGRQDLHWGRLPRAAAGSGEPRTAGWFRLGPGHFPDTGRSLPRHRRHRLKNTRNLIKENWKLKIIIYLHIYIYNIYIYIYIIYIYIYILWRFQWVTRYFWVAGDWLKGVVAHLNVIMTLYKRLGQRWERGLSLCRDWVVVVCSVPCLMSRGYRRTHEMWGIWEITTAFWSISFGMVVVFGGFMDWEWLDCCLS